MVLYSRVWILKSVRRLDRTVKEAGGICRERGWGRCEGGEVMENGWGDDRSRGGGMW